MTRCRLIIALMGVIWITSFQLQAANPVPVVVKVLPGANLSLISNLLGGTIIDTIPEANTVLLRLPALPLLSPVLKLLGVEWIELDRGVSLPKSGQLRLLDVPWRSDRDWYAGQPALQLIRTQEARE
jgi:hypothetical protein